MHGQVTMAERCSSFLEINSTILNILRQEFVAAKKTIAVLYAQSLPMSRVLGGGRGGRNW
jgi:hypothetical protein